MDRVESDQTPAEAWKSSLDATCNRLMTHYHNLLRAAASPSSESSAAGGAPMRDVEDPPPPPLAANVEMTALQAKLAAENLCVASSNALDLIRTLRLSILLTDDELTRAEEEEEALELFESSLQAEEECRLLEAKLMELRRR